MLAGRPLAVAPAAFGLIRELSNGTYVFAAAALVYLLAIATLLVGRR